MTFSRRSSSAFPSSRGASLVCKRWRRLATDPHFLRRFRVHHRKPPLLGDFMDYHGKISFRSTLDPSFRIPPERFSLRVDGREDNTWKLLECRHGRVLVINWKGREVIVWDPITDDHRLVAVPPEFHDFMSVTHNGAVLCAAGDQGHMNCGCHSSSVKVVLLGTYIQDDRAVVAVACVYSSETGIYSVQII